MIINKKSLNLILIFIPQIPQIPWTDEAPTGSSTPSLSNIGIVIHVKNEPITPIIIASHAWYKKQPAVTETKEPNIPLIKSMISILPSFLNSEYNKLNVPPPNEPIIVWTAALAAYCHLLPLTPYVLPELKASHPHHKTNNPMQAFTGFPSGSGAIPSAYLPKRGPNIAAEAKAADPPIKWTGPLPAISTTPNRFKNPCSPQTHPAGIQ